MTNDEIREAISATKEIAKWLDGDANGRHYNVLVALAEEYLKAEGWPEKKDLFSFKYTEAEGLLNRGFNEALRLCKLAAMKEKNEVSRKVIMQTLKSQDVYLPEHYEDLTTTLLKLINGKEA